jgi:dienelactone hydrolase
MPQVIPRSVSVSILPLGLEGDLTVPERARGLVIFAHGSGSSRRSPRNRAVASALSQAGLATLMFDLLLEAEAADRAKVFDIGLLCERLVDALDWAARQPALRGFGLGLFGASTGAAAALCAAAERPALVRAVVSRGGRPDLAGPALAQVRAPTRLIVGGNDQQVLALNDEAFRRMTCVKRIDIVPGATHLFEEPGALERVTELARDWFVRYLPHPPA